MSFSYDPTLADEVSVVRFYLDDTDVTGPYSVFQDEELQFLIDMNGSPLAAATEAAFRLYSGYAQRATVAEVDDVRIDYRDKSEEMYTLYKALKTKTKEEKMRRAKQAPMFFGGIDKSRFDNNREDSSLTPPDFTKGVVRFNRKHPQSTPIDYEYRSWDIFRSDEWE